MHMADALISPAVGGVMCAASAGLAVYSARQLRQQDDDRLIPLMGVTGAFVFAVQMINFGIPGTGSSGHLGGGLLLAVLLGPHAAFLVMTSILIIQSLCFADGGLLALGCNVFNLGALPCFVAYPLVFRPLVGSSSSYGRLVTASLLAAVAGLQLGAFGVVLQTVMSGRTELPFGAFLAMMQPIHLAIGVIEGLATASILGFLWKARPQLREAPQTSPSANVGNARFAWALLVASVLVGGVLSWFASVHPDGLEWSIARTTGTTEELAQPSQVARDLTEFQQQAALLPDYDFRTVDGADTVEAPSGSWPNVSPGASLSGIVGSLLVLLVAIAVGGMSRLWGTVRTQP
ncbi:MAG: energy-coupling factor ABC transporter permease [Planctomycetes bacterium]|nr:energy-coupling factor ABC transporter permease [Planctomycetota bacterium]